MSAELGKYIYCIISSTEKLSFGNDSIGEKNEEITTIVFKDIAAVVSNSPVIEYRVSRNNMMTHEKAIEKVMKDYTVLPVKFGTIADSEAKIIKILEENYSKFSDMLKGIDDKKEIGLKALFYDDKIFNVILEKNKDLADLKEIIAKRPPEKTHHQRARIGEMVQIAFENEKERLKRKIFNQLLPLSEKNVENKTYGDKMIFNAAFLIKKKNEPAFDKTVNKLDSEHGDMVKFKYVTSIPPFNFVNLEIKTV